MAERHQVIIIGGGPVGVGPGVELGLRGIDLRDRRAAEGSGPNPERAEPYAPHVGALPFLGIVDEERAARLMPKDYPIGELTTCGTLLSDYRWGPQRTQPGGGFIRPHYYEDNDRTVIPCDSSSLARLRVTPKIPLYSRRGLRAHMGHTPGRRDHVDDPAAALLVDHDSRGCLRTQKFPLEIHTDGMVPERFVHLKHRAARKNAGVVSENVKEPHAPQPTA